MLPFSFKESNKTFTNPEDLDESQCGSLKAYAGIVEGGSLDGCPQIVTCWQPTTREIELLKEGKPIFISFISQGIPPHYLSMTFEEATHPA